MKIIYKIFAGNNLFNALIIGVFAVLLWMPSFISHETITFKSTFPPMPFYEFISGLIQYNIILSKILAFFIFITIAILLNFLNTKYILTPERNFLPSFFFILITSLFTGVQELNPILPASLILLAVIFFLFLTYKSEPDSLRFFDVGLLIGLGTLFFAPFIYFILLIWIGIIIMRPFYWREWVYPVLGVSSIYLLTWGYYYIFLDEGERIIRLFLNNISPVFITPEIDKFSIIAIVYLLILLVAASAYILKIYQYRKVYIRLFFQIFFWIFFLSLGIFFSIQGNNLHLIYLMALPMTFLFTNYFTGTNKKLGSRILFCLGFLLVIIIKIQELLKVSLL